MAQRTQKAFAYLRTSSAANDGSDKDSDRRQREALEAFAKRAGYVLEGVYYDAAVSGADPIEARPGFASMLQTIAGNGVRTIIVETASRFARDLMVQEVGFAKLRELGIELVAADSPNAFLDDGPTSKLIRQVLGAVAEFDRAMTVAKLRGARERKRHETGEKVEGRKFSRRAQAGSGIGGQASAPGIPPERQTPVIRKIGQSLPLRAISAPVGRHSQRLQCEPWSTVIGHRRPPIDASLVSVS
jgi:DNA invertase Pin-like site-specific DNA recombinase